MQVLCGPGDRPPAGPGGLGAGAAPRGGGGGPGGEPAQAAVREAHRGARAGAPPAEGQLGQPDRHLHPGGPLPGAGAPWEGQSFSALPPPLPAFLPVPPPIPAI